MNKRQKELIQSQLDSEKDVIRDLKRVYQQALDDCNDKIRALSARSDMEDLQSIIYQKQYQEALKKQLEGVLETMHSNEFETISEYLTKCYQDGFVGTMYDLHGQGIPLIMPINQKAVVAAIQTDSKLSKNLYDSLGEDITDLKKTIRTELSRGIANGSTWNQIASDIAGNMKNSPLNKALNNSIRIARTEGHRVQIQSALDAQHEAKKAGADIVKQWDSTLDGATRDTHRQLDGQIRELDEDFEVDGKKASAPGFFGRPEEDINCRCALLQRAKWALDQDELDTLKERAEYFDLDKTNDLDEFKEKYMKASEKENSAQVISERRKKLDEGVFQTINLTKQDSIRPDSIKKELNKSEIGRDTLKYLNDENVPVKLLYGVDNPNNLLGSYDPFEDEISIFCGIAKTREEATSALIHEVMHRKLGARGTFEEEVKCFEAEYIHEFGTLTEGMKHDILREVKELYPDLL